MDIPSDDEELRRSIRLLGSVPTRVLKTQARPERLKTLRKMYRNWPFFRNLLSNAQMALGKSDMSLAREYAGLCFDPDTGRRVPGLMQ